MTQFVFTPLTNDPYKDIQSAALGAAAGENYTAKEKNKFMKLSVTGNNSYELAADGDDIEALLLELEPNSVNSGYPFGSIQKDKRLKVEPTAVLAVGAEVVCGVAEPLGTVLAGYPKVKAGVGVMFRWRVIRVISPTLVLIEKIT
jgi:hypothetical protein